MMVAARVGHRGKGFYGQRGYEFSLLLAVTAAAIGLTGRPHEAGLVGTPVRPSVMLGTRR
jgi:hypothetical protein